MKKSIILSVAVAAMLGVSATCFAGIGMPKIGGAKTPKAPTTETKQVATASIDFTDLNERQGNVLKALQTGLVYELCGYYVLEEAAGMDTQNLVAAQTNLKADPKKNAGKVAKDLQAENKVLTQKIDAIAKGEDTAAKEKLSNAIADAKAFKSLAYVQFGAVAANAPKLAKDASSLSSGVKDLTVLNKIKGITSTASQASKIVPAAKQAFDALDGAIKNAQTAVGEKPVKESAAAEQQAKEIFNM